MSNKRRLKAPQLPRHDLRLADGWTLRYRGHTGNVTRWMDTDGLEVALRFVTTPRGRSKMLGIHAGAGLLPHPNRLNAIVDALIGSGVAAGMRIDENDGWIYVYELPAERSVVTA
jgi:hypothetical protein